MIQNQIVTITTIYPPGEAVKKIAKFHRLIVAGDKKTPKDWGYKDVRFLSVEEQSQLSYSILKLLPFNHYGRKMLAYLEAIKEGAEVVIDTDDDNIPKDKLLFPGFEGKFSTANANGGFVNIYSHFTDMYIWPRGLPLDRIKSHAAPSGKEEIVKVGVWQGLADGDPDVDAIYRLTSNEPCIFRKESPLVLGKGTISPYNSQNTATRKELFPLLYLPAYVTFRFTDILRGLIAQPIMWQAGYRLGFTQATVMQERNPHDYMKDFESEIPCYVYGSRVIDSVTKAINSSSSITDNLHAAYTQLLRDDIVTKDELKLLEAWLEDIQELAAKSSHQENLA